MIKPNPNIFCNTPWYEIHIYWDGSLGICCQESHKLYTKDSEKFNIATMTLQQWFNSQPVREFRTAMLQNKPLSACNRCYQEEDHGASSRRLRSNQKSVIFTRSAFQDSFAQGPGHAHFLHSAQNNGHTTTQPIDLHIDLGNYCNLACKMCRAESSSVIAAQEVKWGIETSRQFLGTDWTRDETVWSNFKRQLLDIPNLSNIHFMGGETLLTNKFDDLVDTMIAHGRFDLCFSFVTNGTVYRAELIEKLKRFRRVGIEISIETVDAHNSYQRQGTDTQQVSSNIQRYLEACNNSSVTVTLRPAVSLLTIGYYAELLQYALDQGLLIKSLICEKPRFLAVDILPTSIKQSYQKKFHTLLAQLAEVTVSQDYNASDPNNYKSVIREQAQMCVNLLSTPTPADSEIELARMVRHCERWDRIYRYDARELYPEFEEIFNRHGYDISS